MRWRGRCCDQVTVKRCVCVKTVQVTTCQAVLQLQHSRTVQLGDNPIYLITVETLYGASVGEGM